MKPLLIGLQNPYSPEPRNALVPFPSRSAGGRLWSVLNALPTTAHQGLDAWKAAVERDIYAKSFSRYNLLPPDEQPTRKNCRKAAAEMLPLIAEGSLVILLGIDVLTAFSSALCKGHKRLEHDEVLRPVFIHPQVVGGVTWRLLPHPSGRSILFNDPITRTLAGLALSDVLHHSGERHGEERGSAH